MIRLEDIVERRIKAMNLEQLRKSFKKDLLNFVYKNYKKWYSKEQKSTKLEYTSEKIYLDYIIFCIDQLVIINITNKHGIEDFQNSETQFVLDFSRNSLLGICGAYRFAFEIEKYYKNFKLEQFLNRRGLYLSSEDKTDNKNTYLVHSNQDELIKPPKTLYHVTEWKYVDSILKKGLQARHSDKLVRDLPRVYVALSMEDADQIADAFMNMDWTFNPALFIIDTSKLRKGTKFYSDEDFKASGAWTYTNIPVSAITLYNENDNPDNK